MFEEVLDVLVFDVEVGVEAQGGVLGWAASDAVGEGQGVVGVGEFGVVHLLQEIVNKYI